MSVFLPKGYPTSVQDGYMKYIIGQVSASVMSTAVGVLSMQGMLIAIGIGNATAIPAAATLNWILKDGLGQMGGVLFASLVNNKFDADPRKWRFISAVALEVSSFIELLTLFAPAYFLPMAAIANIGKNVSFLSASASRAAIHRSFAIHENLADVTAKAGSQSVAASTLGTALGLSIAALVGDSGGVYSALAFVAGSSLSLAAMFYSLKHVSITTVSENRLDMLINQYLVGCIGKSRSSISPHALDVDWLLGRSIKPALPAAGHVDPSVVISPRQLAPFEPIIGGKYYHDQPELIIGSDIGKIIGSEMDMRQIVKNCQRFDGYLLVVDGILKPKVHLWLKQECTQSQFLAAYVHATIVRLLLSSGPKYFHAVMAIDQDRGLQCSSEDGNVDKLCYNIMAVEAAYDWMTASSSSGLAPTTDEAVAAYCGRNRVEQFVHALSSGSTWAVDTLLLETVVARVSWDEQQ